MPRKAKTTNPSENWNYEEAVSQVEAVIEQLESGQLPLAEVFAQFEQAVTALKQCETYLQSKQEQVDLLIETLESS